MKNRKASRKIDQDFCEGRSWLSKKVILVKKSKLINLKNLIILAFIAGAVIATIWIVDTNRQTQSKAAVFGGGDQQQAEQSASNLSEERFGSGGAVNGGPREMLTKKLANGFRCVTDGDCVSGRCGGCFWWICLEKKCY